MSTCSRLRSAVVALTALTVCWTAANAPRVSAADPDKSSAADARLALADFDEFVDEAIVDWNVPGTALAVVAGGEVVFAQGFGQRDVERELPMTADSLFAIGSTSKAFTTTVLGTLVDAGVVDWDTPVRTYLPDFRLYDPITTELITPRDLVTHRSGLPRHDMLWYNNNDMTRAEAVGRLAYLEPTEPLRSKFQYNNLMYLTAGYLIEQLTGTSWEEAVRARIFEPLGMTRSTFSVHDSQRDEDFAQPYRENEKHEIERIPFRAIDLVGPAGSINSSVDEMTRWLLLNLNHGKVGDQQLINASTLADIHSPHMTTGSTVERPEISQSTYGLGWSITTYRGHLRVAHGGGIDGFVTSVMLFPNDEVGMVSFTNIGSPLARILNQHAADRIFGLEPIDWNAEGLERRAKGKKAQDEAQAQKEATRVTGSRPSHPLADYAGDYEHPGYGTLSVDQSGESLTVTFNNITASLEHWHYDVFNAGKAGQDEALEDLKFLFRGDVNGNVAAVEATLEPQVDPVIFRKGADPRLSDPDYLQRFAGSYDLAGQTGTVELVGEYLTVNLPGGSPITLLPDLSGRFVFKESRVISIDFEVDDEGKVIGAKLYQPDGVYELKRTN